MLNRTPPALLIVVVVLLLTSALITAPASAARNEQGGDSEVTATAEQGAAGGADMSIAMEWSSTLPGASVGGEYVVSGESTTATVHPVCWYEPDLTGTEMAAEMTASLAGQDTSGSHIQARMDYESHATDDGRWYRGMCDISYAPDPVTGYDTILAFHSQHPPYTWVPTGQPAPTPFIDGATLAAAAYQALNIPAPQIAWNPTIGDSGATIVGMDTWVWATGDTPRTVTITASAGPVSATLVANSVGLRLSTTDGDPDCQGFGLEWKPGMAEGTSPCTIVFNRSSAHLGGTTPVTVSVSYGVTWTASDSTSGTLNSLTTSSTANVPVAEIQTLNTRSSQD